MRLMSFGVFTGEREMLGAVLGNQWGSWGPEAIR